MLRIVSLVIASTAVAATASAMAPECQTGPYQRYLAAPGPKAFAAGKTRGCGWQIKSNDYVTTAAIRGKALAQCREFGGDNCRVIAEGK